MDWSDIGVLFLMFIIGAIVGAYYIYRQVLHNVSNDPRRMIDILEKIEKINLQEAEQKTSKDSDLDSIKSEVHNGITYLFDKDTDEFLGQGTSFADALDIANKRFPNRFSVKIVAADSQSS